MYQDLRSAIRALLHRSGFSAGVVLTLGIARAAFTAILSVVHELILELVPFPEADRTVVMDAIVGDNDGRLSLREYEELQRERRFFDEWAAYYPSHTT